MTPKCHSRFGHHFTPRYSVTLPSDQLVARLDSMHASFVTIDMIKALTRKRYIGDICTRCGYFIAKADVNE